MKIRFRSINAIEEFLDIVNSFSAEIDIKSKRTTVDGKSMMGFLVWICQIQWRLLQLE